MISPRMPVARQVDAESESGETALTAACRHGQMDVAKLLLLRGADVAHVTADGRSALQLAEAHGAGVLRMLRGERHGRPETRARRTSDRTPRREPSPGLA